MTAIAANITAQTNQDFLKQLDEEGILLTDYLTMIAERMLIKAGVLPLTDAEDFLKELHK